MTPEQIQKEIDEIQEHPMFMTELPKNPEDNKYLSAIQSIKYEGKPEDVCLDLLAKSQEALKLYESKKNIESLKEAMFNICNAIDHVKDDNETSNKIKGDLYLHRGRIQNIVKNWGYAIQDLLKSKSFNEDLTDT